MVTIDARTAVLPPRRVSTSLGLRMYLLGRAFVLAVTSLFGAVLFSLWVTAVSVSPLTVLAWLVLPTTALVRAYANANRRAAGSILGEAIPAPYRTADSARWTTRVWTTVKDPASWRDAWWMLVHSVAGCFLATLQFSLFLAGLLYLLWPFLYWVTPQNVFGQPFGIFELHSVAQATLMMPLAVIAFGLWFALAVPLTRAEANLTRALLR